MFRGNFPILFFVFVALSHAQEGKIIAVSELVNCSHIANSYMDSIAERIRSIVAQDKNVVVIDKKLSKEILDAQNVGSCPACSTMKCLDSLAKLLMANTMIGGSIGRDDDIVTIRLLMIDAKKTKLFCRISKEIASSKTELLNKHIPSMIADLMTKPSEKLDLAKAKVSGSNAPAEGKKKRSLDSLSDHMAKASVKQDQPASRIPGSSTPSGNKKGNGISPMMYIAIPAAIVTAGIGFLPSFAKAGNNTLSNQDIPITDAPSRKLPP